MAKKAKKTAKAGVKKATKRAVKDLPVKKAKDVKGGALRLRRKAY